METMKTIQTLAREMAHNWRETRSSSMAAAIAFRSVFSLIPLVFLLSAFFRWVQVWFDPVLGHIDMQQFGQASVNWGSYWDTSQFEKLIGVYIENQIATHVISIVAGFVIVILGAMSVFNELIISVHVVWQKKQHKGLVALARQRFLAVGAIGGLAFLALAAMLVRFLLGIVEESVLLLLPSIEFIKIGNGWALAFLFTFSLLVMINKYVPRAELTWRNVSLSSLVSTPLLLLGQYLLSVYIESLVQADKFGGFGMYIAFMLWVYYSAMMLLFSVHLTRAFVERRLR